MVEHVREQCAKVSRLKKMNQWLSALRFQLVLSIECVCRLTVPCRGSNKFIKTILAAHMFHMQCSCTRTDFRSEWIPQSRPSRTSYKT